MSFTFPEPIETDRLILTAVGEAVLDAWADRDAERLDALLGARFAGGAPALPPFEESLPAWPDRLRDDPEGFGVTWMVLSKASREPLGVVGVSPVEPAVWRVGYSVFPERQRRGYATEAVRIAVAWALGQPGVRTVRATIPAWNLPSIRVAEKIGMAHAGTDVDPEAGEVLVYERRDAPAL
ncbi:MAG: GNAT family N-acetyltransferase [Gemmatimonadota bacterium]|nr:GNAT family N-acetyltransferase [Gemmatimonadota bacterium]